MGRTELKQPMQGIQLWKNEKNRFTVFESHYTADASKRDGYIDAIKASMPLAKFRQEFELVWESFVGKAVYSDWNKNFHGRTGLQPQIGLPILIGVDQGLHPAAVVCQLQEETLVVLKEYCRTNMGGDRFSKYVADQLRIDFPEWTSLAEDFICGMDPTGFNRRDTDERTYAATWTATGFKPHPGDNGWEKRRSAVEEWLIKSRKGEACFQVNLAECPILVEGFDGGYRYPDSTAEIEPTKIKPVKDKYSQPHDALQYILTYLKAKRKIAKRAIPSLGYYHRGQK